MTQNNPQIGGNQLWSQDALNYWQENTVWTPLVMGSANWTSAAGDATQAAWAFSPSGLILLKGIVTSGSDTNVDPLATLSDQAPESAYGSYLSGFLNDDVTKPIRIYASGGQMHVSGQTVDTGNTVRLDGYMYIPQKSGA